MPNHYRPGQNIRQLARRRRAKAIRAFIPAIALGVFLAIITFYFTAPPLDVYALGAFSIGMFIEVG
ncbi:MAG: hypothetical protein EA342_02235 [Leptolyngbya sp. LCM1.Bin17]|nr:MAG: hypothetical protein EA342_02235 [Leptolyngbya sp. LCM1.Bin17]